MTRTYAAIIPPMQDILLFDIWFEYFFVGVNQQTDNLIIVWRQVFPYTECGMGMESQEYTKSVLQPKLFVEKTCTQVRSLVMLMLNWWIDCDYVGSVPGRSI